MISNSSYLEPPEFLESPIIHDICPNCQAMGVDWKNHKVKEWTGYDEYIGNINYVNYNCPSCNNEIKWNDYSSDGFGVIFSDDLFKIIQEKIPSNVTIIGTETNPLRIVIDVNGDDIEIPIEITNYHIDFNDLLTKLKELKNEKP